jgi:hypothetical protein
MVNQTLWETVSIMLKKTVSVFKELDLEGSSENRYEQTSTYRVDTWVTRKERVFVRKTVDEDGKHRCGLRTNGQKGLWGISDNTDVGRSGQGLEGQCTSP